MYLLFLSYSEVPVDRAQITGWEDLLLQYRDQAVHMGETRWTQISCRGTNFYHLHNKCCQVTIYLLTYIITDFLHIKFSITSTLFYY